MQRDIKSSGEEILNEDILSAHETNFIIPDFKKICCSLILGICMLFFSIFIHYKYIVPLIKTDYNDLTMLKFKILLSIAIYFFLYEILDFSLLIFTKCTFSHNYKIDICSLVLYKKSIMVKTCLSMFLYCLLWFTYEYLAIPTEINKNSVTVTQKDVSMEKLISEYIILNFFRIMLAISGLLGVYLVKSLGMCVIELKMFFSHYKNRLAENEENTQIIEFLNRSTGLKMLPNLQTWGHYVFKSICPDDDLLTFEMCENRFGTLHTQRIFKLFDINNDFTITPAEFVNVYFGVIREKSSLNRALLQKKQII